SGFRRRHDPKGGSTGSPPRGCGPRQSLDLPHRFAPSKKSRCGTESLGLNFTGTPWRNRFNTRGTRGRVVRLFAEPASAPVFASYAPVHEEACPCLSWTLRVGSLQTSR